VEDKWGKKRTCLSCGARFYDMLRSPIICPKCETEFVPVVTGRGSRAKAPAPVPSPEQAKPEIEKKENLDLLAEEEDIPDDSGLGILDDDDDDDLIEDTSDLGTEDSVLDGMGGDPQKTDNLTE
tara:strand:+ start:127 stop:498 length:372 start_codon:yes stop_codon:yes gene_type:complete